MAPNSAPMTKTTMDIVVTAQASGMERVGLINVTMPTPMVATYTLERLKTLDRLFGIISNSVVIL